MGYPSTKTIKLLYANSFNVCSFPDCKQQLVINDINVGEIAHIEAQSEGGPRFNPSLMDLHSEENLILLCPTHHKIIDSDITNYTVEYLKQIKLNHSKLNKNTTFELKDEILNKIIESFKISFRELTNSEISELENRLKNLPPEVFNIQGTVIEPGSTNLTFSLKETLERIGWKITGHGWELAGKSNKIITIFITGSSPTIAQQTLADFLHHSGFTVRALRDQSSNTIYVGNVFTGLD